MAPEDTYTQEQPLLWVVKSTDRERVETRDLPAYWEKAPKGCMLMIGHEVVAVKV